VNTKINFIRINYLIKIKPNKGRLKMNYKLFGKSGLRVSELALGTMTFGEEWGWGANRGKQKGI